MKKKIITAMLSLLLSYAALAEPYRAFDYDSLFVTQENGSKSVDVGALDTAVATLRQHAGEYPTTFDSESDKQQAKKDIILLSKTIHYLLVEVVKGSDKALEQHLMLLEARVAVMAYNFDYVNALALADKRYEMLIAKTADPALKAEYGFFLANSARTEKAEKILKSALDAGEKSALYALAMLSIVKHDREQAIQYFKDYLKYSPDDARAKQLLKALEDDKVVIQNEKVSE